MKKKLYNLYNSCEGIIRQGEDEMNLQSAKELSELRTPQPKKVEPKVRSAVQVARRVFKLAASGGFPYRYQTPEGWAKKWLSSKEFVLMEIDINAAASPNKPKNPARVAHYLKCSIGSQDPIVVDMNKRKVGKTRLGYIPEVIVLDGKHRKQASIQNGRLTIMAWVGKRAVKRIKPSKTLKASIDRTHSIGNGNGNGNGRVYDKTSTTEYLYAATVPGQGIPTKMQDTGVGGSRPVDTMHTNKKVKAGGPGSGRHPDDIQKEYREKAERGELQPGDKEKYQRMVKVAEQQHDLRAGKTGDCKACGARSSGSLEDTVSPSDAKISPDQSDASTRIDPSDRLKWNSKKAQLNAPGTKGHASTIGYGSPNLESPGSGVGPRVKNTGASNSEFSRSMQFAIKVNAKGKKIAKMWDKAKKMWIDAVAPPGFSEETMHKLKRKHGTTSAFKIAWSTHNRTKADA